jgi:3-oxoacyl-[acyl-carrier protein] reductase
MPHIRHGGRIINISSRTARVPTPGGVYLYAASKAALENFTRNLATEFAAEKGITVNNVMPGPTDTGKFSNHLLAVSTPWVCVDMCESERQVVLSIGYGLISVVGLDALREAPSELVERTKTVATAEKRLGKPEEIASVVAFMAEDGSRWINGDTICVTGGAAMW